MSRIRILKRDLSDPKCDYTHPRDCPIARAVFRLVKSSVNVLVTPDSIYIGTKIFPISGGKGRFAYIKQGVPFSLNLNIPKSYLKRKK